METCLTEIRIFANIGILCIESNETHPATHTSFHEPYKPHYHLKNCKFDRFGGRDR